MDSVEKFINRSSFELSAIKLREIIKKNRDLLYAEKPQFIRKLRFCLYRSSVRHPLT